jgi:hypothetical protein
METPTPKNPKQEQALSFLPVRPAKSPVYKDCDVRFDQNVVKNIDTLFDLFGIADDDADNNLRRSVIYYLCYHYQQDLFSYLVFDPYEFAERMGYKNTSWLRHKHANPLFAEDFKQMSKKEQAEHTALDKPMYETNIGNALYSLLKKEVIFTRKPRIYCEKKDSIIEYETVKMSILRKVTVSTRKSGKTGQVKTVYLLEMDERFLRSLTQYFIRGSISAVSALRASKLDILYAKLLELREYAMFHQNSTTDIIHFEMLCDWCRIPQKKKDGSELEARERKRLVRRALENVSKASGWNFGVDSIKGKDQKFAYVFRIYWNFPDNVKELKTKADRDDRKEMFEQYLYRELGAYYRGVKCADKNPLNTDIGGLKGWLAMDVDRDEKERIYMLACDRIYGQETEEQKRYRMRRKGFEDFYKMATGGKSNGWHGSLMVSQEEC